MEILEHVLHHQNHSVIGSESGQFTPSHVGYINYNGKALIWISDEVPGFVQIAAQALWGSRDMAAFAVETLTPDQV
jgi:hypothetical protein